MTKDRFTSSVVLVNSPPAKPHQQIKPPVQIAQPKAGLVITPKWIVSSRHGVTAALPTDHQQCLPRITQPFSAAVKRRP